MLCFSKTSLRKQPSLFAPGPSGISRATRAGSEEGRLFSQAKVKRIVIFRKRSTQSEFLDVFCVHVTNQIWAWFETFKGNVNRTNTVNFDAHWTSGAKKGILRFP